jgi:hypothetical protein
MLDEENIAICKQLNCGVKIKQHYDIKDDLFCWKNRLYVQRRLRKRVMNSEHDPKVAGYFRSERTMKLLTRKFYWANMEKDIRKYCNECDNCQRTQAPHHAKHGLLHPLEMACKPWTHISTDFITDSPESEGATMLLVVVNHFAKMAQFVPMKTKDSPTVARAYFENVWKYPGFPEHVDPD